MAAPSLRDRMVLATKGGISEGVPYDSSARHLRSACEASLRRLGVDVIDLYQVQSTRPAGPPGRGGGGVSTSWWTPARCAPSGSPTTRRRRPRRSPLHLRAPLVATQPELSALQLAPARRHRRPRHARRAGGAGVEPKAGGRLAGSGPSTDDTLRIGLELVATLRMALPCAEARVDRATVALAFVLAPPVPPRGHPRHAVGGIACGRRWPPCRSTSTADCYRIIEASEGVLP
ncbi:MAG: aldo/keto reductase [Acidimicrobiales bacterium]